MTQVSDVDGTMIEDNGRACAAANDFREYWENSAALCSSVMVYNTGRSIGQLTGLLEARRDCMVMPDAIITAVGTKVHLPSKRVTRATATRNDWCGAASSHCCVLAKCSAHRHCEPGCMPWLHAAACGVHGCRHGVGRLPHIIQF